MKLILAKAGVKREIEGPFGICASRADLERLRDRIDEVLARDFNYGWFEVAPHFHHSAPDTQPRKWEE